MKVVKTVWHDRDIKAVQREDGSTAWGALSVDGLRWLTQAVDNDMYRGGVMHRLIDGDVYMVIMPPTNWGVEDEIDDSQSYNLCKVVTGRLSCSKPSTQQTTPNAQQMRSRMVIKELDEDYDHDDVIWVGTDGRGYKGKKHRRICVERCPKCHLENHSMSVSSGYCAWCGFNPNEE